MRRIVVVLLLVTAADVRADGPWAVTAGAGPSVSRAGYSATRDFRLGATARVDAGYHFIDNTIFGAAVGPHIGIAIVRAREYSSDGSGKVINTYVPFEVGVGAQLVIADRFLIAPWVGYVSFDHAYYRSAGVALGYDIHVCGPERISAVAMYTRAPGRDSISYDTIGLGVAYRYW